MTQHQAVNPQAHADLRVHTHADAALGDGVMATLVVPQEFRKVQAYYPIVFRRDIESGDFSALALFGFEQGENLYLEDRARWDNAYRPMSLAIQPFLIGSPREAGGDPQVHVNLAHPRIATGGEGVRIFDEDGKPTPYLEAVAAQLGDLHVGYSESGDFYAALARHNLLEPFSLNVTLSGGTEQTLVGFHIIDEDRLRELDGAALADLHQAGHLMPIFMAMASLSQLSGLVAQKDAKQARG